jgi:hypothetical protein
MFSSLSEFLLISSVFFISSAILFIVHFVIFNKKFKSVYRSKDNKSLIDFSSFLNNIVGPLFAIGGALIIYSTIVEQNEKDNRHHFETVYFKNIEYHRDNNKGMSVVSPYNGKIREGRSAFINFNALIRDIVTNIKKESQNKLDDEDISNLAFQMFYVGINDTTELVMLKNTFSRYKHKIDVKRLLERMNKISDSLKDTSVRHLINGNKAKLSSYYSQYFSTIELLHNYAEEASLTDYQIEYYSNLLLQHDGHYEKSLLFMYLMSDSFKDENKSFLRKYIRFNKSDTIEFNSIMRKLVLTDDSY